MRISDWSSDVCSSDLIQHLFQPLGIEHSCSAIVDEGKEPNSMTLGATCGMAGWERALGRSMIMRLHLMEDLVSEICSVDDEDELHAALMTAARRMCLDRKSTRLNSSH